MSLGPVILLTVIWLAMFKILTCESLHNSGIHRGRHKYKRRHLFSEENNRHVRLHYENLPLEQDASLLMLDEDNEDVSVDASFELDKPREYFNKRFYFYFFYTSCKCFRINSLDYCLLTI
jgi:hypothetical protein